MAKNKFLLFLIFFSAFLFSGANFVSAMEADLGLGNNPDLPKYITFIFSWAISIAGTIALISFAIGAVGLIISGDSTELAGNSKDRMKNAILGLILIMAAYLIMNTINPALVNPTLTPLPPGPTIAVPIPPGVYYYTQLGCAGDSSGPNTSSQDAIDSAFAGKIKSIKIINDPAHDIYYGVIFHATPGLENAGPCGQPIKDAGCQPISISAYAVNIFSLNKKNNISPSGTGVAFYSEAYGYNAGAQNRGEGFCAVNNNKINGILQIEANDLNFGGGGSSYDCGYSKKTLPQYKGLYTTFQYRPGSINIKGNYLVALYSGGYCQVFSATAPNLNMQPFIAARYSVSDIYIIPTK
jgi:hypothetical protein